MKRRTEFTRSGTTFTELGGMFEAHGLDAEIVPAGTTTIGEFRRSAIRTLNNQDEFLVVNYQRSEMGQVSGGHISPVTAYHAETDKFLVLDAARYKYPPFWVEASELFAAMNTQVGSRRADM
ncbi:phytochelatin synthase family protein [Hyphomonas sp.]|uniref:phytochelatin synthase family protein n=1 Tax=Hyphomonas sp. TaxID=87 RepID=UPI00352792DB